MFIAGSTSEISNHEKCHQSESKNPGQNDQYYWNSDAQ